MSEYKPDEPGSTGTNPIIDHPDSQRQGHFRRNLLGYGVAGASMLAVASVGYLMASIDTDGDRPDRRAPIETDDQNSVSFTEIVNHTQERERDLPKVLKNFDLARVLNNDLAPGENTVETITITTAGCELPSGRVTSKRAISRALIRNSDNVQRFNSAFLTNDHMADFEQKRLEHLKQRAKTGYEKINPEPIGVAARQQIFRQVTADLCGSENAALLDPRLSSHALVIRSTAFEGRNSYEDGTPLQELGARLRTPLIMIGVIGILALGVGIVMSRSNNNGNSHDNH